ncbi:16S rRNA (cytosine(1402)-N(4))-methyltransferase RsmH [bacterium]|nr:16S rRNA (cytosine(1402)-N(4))-methyltransferase RsmH [bacterium]
MHIPVLQKEVLEYLSPKPNENFIDATIGEGGHTLGILRKNKPKGKVLGIEIDPQMYQRLKTQMKKFLKRLILVNDSYVNLKEIVKRYRFKANGILFDLGMSSWHIEESGRGFTFQKDERLDMRYDPKNYLTAEKIVNRYKKREIERILREYGGERFAKRIAKKICERRKIEPIKTTFQLKEIIKRAFPRKYKWGRIHYATRTFQALRIAVNNELENLRKALPQAFEILEPKGKLVVISFHSGEDKIVKEFLKEKAKEGNLQILTKKPVRPTPQEIKVNPRSRSARLRAGIKTF